MTLDIYVGNQNEYCVSGSTREIFDIVAQSLEKGEFGSRFPLVHDLSQELVVPWKKAKDLIDELSQARCELALLSSPVAACFSGKNEVDYFPMIQPKGVFRLSCKSDFEDNGHYCSGVDERGLFVARSLSSTSYDGIPAASKVYYHRRTKGQKNFRLVLPPIPYVDELNIDRVEHAWKSTGRVWDPTIESLIEICHKAIERKKNISQR